MSLQINLDASEFINYVNNLEKELLNNKDIAEMVTNEFKSKFDTKEWKGEPWKQSLMNPDTLVDSGDLKNSIHFDIISGDEILFSTDMKYAEIHNQGGEIVITDRQRKFFWAKYKETGLDMWKYMGMKRVGEVIYIPKRTFMGDDDETIIKKIEEMMVNRYTRTGLSVISKESYGGSY